MKTTLDKEKIILEVCYECNNQMKQLCEENKSLNISANRDTYLWGLKSLMEDCGVQFDSNFNPLIKASIQNKHKNYYVYFKNVLSFINGYEPSIQRNLNESMDKSSNIQRFRRDLMRVIAALEKQDDFEKYNDNILKLKTSLNQPLSVNGFNVIGNRLVLDDIENFYGNKIKGENLLNIVYNKNQKCLYYVIKEGFVTYDIKTDEFFFTKLNQCNFEKLKTYLGVNNLLKIYQNVSALNLKFEDNLYKDRLAEKLHEQYLKSQETVVYNSF